MMAGWSDWELGVKKEKSKTKVQKKPKGKTRKRTIKKKSKT